MGQVKQQQDIFILAEDVLIFSFTDSSEGVRKPAKLELRFQRFDVAQ